MSISKVAISRVTCSVSPEPSSSYILNVHLSFSSSEPEVVMSVAIINSFISISVSNYKLVRWSPWNQCSQTCPCQTLWIYGLLWPFRSCLVKSLNKSFQLSIYKGFHQDRTAWTFWAIFSKINHPGQIWKFHLNHSAISSSSNLVFLERNLKEG